MTDAAEINQFFDLLSLVGQDTQLHKTDGWYIGPCPFCGGRDRFNLKQTPEGWRWFCRGCGDDRYHTTLDYIMRRESLDFREALEWAALSTVGGGSRSSEESRKKTFSSMLQAEDSPRPGEAWQARALAFVEACELLLWSEAGDRARDYLHQRGLKDNTLRSYRIGYNPSDTFESLESWGLPEEINEKGNPKKVWIPNGIIIPCSAGGEYFYIKIRRPLTPALEKKGEQKYIKIKGSKPGIFGADNLRGAWLAVFTEGEFDAMLLDQEACDLAGVATLGSATDRLHRLDIGLWGRYLLPLAYILAAYDLDPEGAKGIRALESFTDRALHAPLPELVGVKDITDLWKTGADLWDWVCRTVERLDILPKDDWISSQLDQAEKFFKESNPA